MTTFYVAAGLVAVVLAGMAIRIISRVESHSRKTPEEVTDELTFWHTLVSLLLYPLGFLAFTIVVLTLIPMIVIFSPKYLHPLARTCARFIMLSIGVIVRVTGKERFLRPKAFVVMFNHESLFDAILLGTVLYRYITALGAAYQFKLPLWGLLLRKWGIIPIPRTKLHQAIRSIELAREKLEAGIPVFVSPEGTRTLTGKIREFKKGPFHLAIEAKADILPMVFRGAFEIKRKTDWRIRPGVVYIDVGDFILYEDYKGMGIKQLQFLVRERLRRMKGEIA